nr:ulp1 protease family, C-terminal catalytic domain-containing protein [Tanacetum cinerariifolium]
MCPRRDVDTFVAFDLLFPRYLCENQHPKHDVVAEIKARITKLKWRTTTNHVDCGVYPMIHMESYIGEPAARWNIGLCTESEIDGPLRGGCPTRTVHPLSPAYIPNPIELDEHVPVHILEPEHLEYHVPSDEDVQVEDDDDDPEEDPSEEHEPEDDNEDPEEDPNEEHEPEDSDETKPFEEDEIAITPPPPRHHRARITVRPQTSMVASTQALIDVFDAGSSPFPLPPTSPAYDLAPLGHRTAMIRIRDDIPKEDTPPQRRFVFTAPLPGCDVAESSAAAAVRAPRAVDRAEGVGYARALQASEHRMMTSIKGVNLRVTYQAQIRRQESKYFYTQLHDAQTNRKDIRLKIDVVRGQRTAYETELQEVHQAYLSSKARNRALLAQIETLETHMSRMEWQCQSAEDLVVTQMMRIHALKARARIDTVEDADNSC